MIQRLLYVDDDEDIRAIVQLALELDGQFEVTLADSGARALDLISTGLKPDIIVLDVMMPGMDGLATLAQIRRILPPSIPVIFMTAKGRQADVTQYLKQGACGVILKPFDPIRLGADIRARIRDG